ncbi:rRNA-processing protein FCF1 [Nymphon striatum]|nr:rRNA-processing protein FCF1 [Nymphon striatum]
MSLKDTDESLSPTKKTKQITLKSSGQGQDNGGIFMSLMYQGKAKKTKCAAMKRMISLKDVRIKKEQRSAPKKKEEDPHELKVRDAPQISSALFFKYNTQLGPPYHILLDTNFLNFSIKNKLDVIKSMMDCLYAKCIPYITDCVLAELEKLGSKYRIALRIAKDPRFERLPCLHKGTYADDCLVQRVTQHKCYIVATCDKDLKRRIRKIPGVPIMYIYQHKFSIERMPDAYGAPKL